MVDYITLPLNNVVDTLINYSRLDIKISVVGVKTYSHGWNESIHKLYDIDEKLNITPIINNMDELIQYIIFINESMNDIKNCSEMILNYKIPKIISNGMSISYYEEIESARNQALIEVNKLDKMSSEFETKIYPKFQSAADGVSDIISLFSRKMHPIITYNLYFRYLSDKMNENVIKSEAIRIKKTILGHIDDSAVVAHPAQIMSYITSPLIECDKPPSIDLTLSQSTVVTRENLNMLLKNMGFKSSSGLSVDIIKSLSSITPAEKISNVIMKVDGDVLNNGGISYEPIRDPILKPPNTVYAYNEIINRMFAEKINGKINDTVKEDFKLYSKSIVGNNVNIDNLAIKIINEIIPLYDSDTPSDIYGLKAIINNPLLRKSIESILFEELRECINIKLNQDFQNKSVIYSSIEKDCFISNIPKVLELSNKIIIITRKKIGEMAAQNVNRSIFQEYITRFVKETLMKLESERKQFFDFNISYFTSVRQL